ncbi:EscU/YscU/HrcU family type III secretion system export apparatus switch protein [Pinirhizobacter sp.]|jgi:flagellar biosynthetic protein FlhB|uniref:EscU/YscU/HrcU family type III secretion system export apparatus switch protein n=1 Tax=Pinirhizobacter sp. TaxID=2950432 RepID=UPI002F42EF56
MAETQGKTEQPTHHRLQEARGKGQAAKSTELTSVVTLAVFLMAFSSGLVGLARACAAAMRSSIAMAGAAPTFGEGFAHWIGGNFAPVGQALLPAVLALVVSAVAANVLQTGGLLSITPLQPDMSRMNPVQGFKRIFSLRTVWDLARLVIKLGVLVALMAWLIRANWPMLLASAAAPVDAVPSLLAGLFGRVTGWMLTVLGLIAVLDVIYSRREFLRKMRMSRTDIKDEHKRTQGDPAIRSRRRRLAREMLSRIKAVARVPSADVIVTNPTHVAVALQYRKQRMAAPIVLAKGAGLMAVRIRKVAARSGVPVVRSPALARALFSDVGIDQPVSAGHYTEVGALYRWVMSRPGHKVLS